MHGCRPKFHFALKLGLVLVLPFFWGCTRDNAKSSGISVDVASLISSVGRSAGVQSASAPLTYVQHIVINVRDGAGNLALPPILWDSDCHCYPRTFASAPSSFSVTIPNGTNNMLVQVVVAGNNSSPSDSVTVARYGDASVDMSGGQDQSVTVTEADFGSGNGAQGTLTGRYVDANGAGRSGRLIMQLVPPNGKPPVAIEAKDIFGGWFRVAILDGIPFRYMFEDGSPVLSSVMLSSGQLAVNGTTLAAGASLIGLSVPAYWQNLGAGNCVLRGAQTNYFGFFGDATFLATTNIVYPSGTTAQPYQFRTQTDCQATTNTGSLNFVPTSAGINDIGRVGGAGGLTTGSGTSFGNLLNLNGSNLAFHSAAAFHGAYRLSNGRAVALTYNAPGAYLTASWTYLNPETFSGPSAAAGTEIFYKKYAPGDSSFLPIDAGDRPSCDLLPSLGFLSAGSTSGYAQTSLVIPSVGVNDSVGVVACTFQSNFLGIVKRYFQTVAATGFQINFNPNSSFANLPTATQIVLSLVTPSTTVVTNTCVPVHVATRTANGALGALASANWSATGNYDIYRDPTCTTGLAISALPATVNDTIYFKLNATSGGNQITLGGGGLSGSLNLNAASTAGTANTAVFWVEKNSVAVSECLAGAISLRDLSNVLLSTNPTNYTVTVAGAGSASAVYAWSDTTCATAVTSLTLSSGQTSVAFRYKALSSAASGFTFSTSPSLTTDVSHANLAISALSGAPVQLSVWTGAHPADSLTGAGSCLPLYVQSMDANFLPSVVTAAQNLSLSSMDPNVNFYSDSTCVTSLGSTPSIAAGTSMLSSAVYMSTTTVGPSPVSATNGTNLSGTSYFQSATPKLVLDLSTLFAVSATNYMIPYQGTAADCRAVMVSSVLGGKPYGNHGNPITLTLAAGGFSVFSDSTCTTSISQGLIPAYATNGIFYLKPASVTTSQPNFVVSDLNGHFTTAPNFNLSSGVKIVASFSGAALSIASPQCSATTVTISFTDIFGVPLTTLVGLPNSGAISYNLTTPASGASWNYYFEQTSAACSSDTAHLTSDASTAPTKSYFMTKSGTGTSGTATFNIPSSVSFATFGTATSFPVTGN